MAATWYKLVDHFKVRHDDYIMLSYSITISMDAKHQSLFGPFIQDKTAPLITSSLFVQILMEYKLLCL